MDIFSRWVRQLIWPALLPFCLLSVLPAVANPTGGVVTQGTAKFSSSGNAFNINQTSANAFITWQTFNIGAGETTTFNQPSASSVTWNQINDANPSQILGNLNANGLIVLQNANGFYVGGQAAITAHGLVMTTASSPYMANFDSSSGPWSFNSPPISAKIQNYGQINITGGGTGYLIASDIENHGTISAPGGNIGLYAGETVLVSTSPTGQGLSAEVTLPQGSVDNEGKLIADLGSIAAQAKMVNQDGLVQADSVKNVNGTIELVASDTLTLGANSFISAQGDSTTTTVSSGGSVQLQAGNTFSDQAGSVIDVAGGAMGGNGGQISISAPQMSALNTTLYTLVNPGYSGGTLSINTTDIGFNSGATPIAGALALDANSFGSGFSKINLDASDSITLDAPWVVAANNVSLVAGNSITLNSGSGIAADAGTISLSAPTVNQDGTLRANSIGSASGTIDINASQSLNLGANSLILAQGDSTVANSSGGSVQLQSGNSFSDQAGSVINVSGGTQGGNGGQISISAPGMSSLNSSLSGKAAAGYAGGKMSINAEDITGTLAQNIAQAVSAASSGFSQINLEAADSIELSSQLTLAPESGVFGSVSLVAGNTITMDAGSKIQADAGRISLNASTVNLYGTLQANSIGGNNGAVEVNAGTSLNLGAHSLISAAGTSGTSPGGFVVLYSSGSFSDIAGSTINVSSSGGAQNGIIEIFGNNIAAPTDLNSSYGNPYALLINPNSLVLSTSPTSVSGQNLYMGDMQNYSEICLYNIELASAWDLGSTLNLSAMNNIQIDPGAGIYAGSGCNVSLTAGTSLPFGYQPDTSKENDGIYLYDGSAIQSANGNINVWAANEVQVGWSGSSAGIGNVNSGSGGIVTEGGGCISVTALYGDVNSGSSLNGYVFNKNTQNKPYYTVDPSLGGISTAAGGNVNISAGGDVISYLPKKGDSGDSGVGAFGPEAGNVTINAVGNVYGHYVLANGVGTITAGKDVGQNPHSATSLGGPFALSLIDGTWNVNAPNGSIYLQEVRNPNGVFNNVGKPSNNKGYHLFNYGANATVNLNAGVGVELTDANLPRPTDLTGLPISSEIPALYAPILNITAGSGGVLLDGDVTLMPSADQNLSITTIDGGGLSGTVPLGSPTPSELLMSDSGNTRFTASSDFTDTDHGNLANEPVASDSDPVQLNISGSMENLQLVTTKQTQITVGQDMTGCSFSGQNLNANDITSITVAGQIYNRSPYSFVYNVTIPNVPVDDLPAGISQSWNIIFLLALQPNALIQVPDPSLNIPPSQWANYALTKVPSLFGTYLTGNTSGEYNGQLNNAVQSLLYNPSTGRLGFSGQMPSGFLSQVLTQTKKLNPDGTWDGTSYYPVGTYTVLVFKNGVPQTYVGPDGNTYFQTTTATLGSDVVASIQALSTETIGAPPAGHAGAGMGYLVGGPGQFDVNAGSISLGNAQGIISEGVAQNLPADALGRFQNLASITPSGATVNVTVSGELDMLSSSIAAIGGGDVNVTSTGGSMDLGSPDLGSADPALQLGIYTSGNGNVNVTAFGDVNIDGSRIATFNGGNIFVESKEGNVNVGNGGNELNYVYFNFVDPITHLAETYQERVFGSGIIADTLASGAIGEYPPAGVPAPTSPGNITVVTPQGDITATLGGILQQTLNGTFPVNPSPTIDLEAGTPNPPGDWNSKAPPLYVGNIDLGTGGAIGGTVNVEATGSFKGLIFARQNTTVQVAQSFSGVILAGGQADVSASTVSGTIAGIGGVSVTGDNSANLLSQNVSANGNAANTLGSSATASASSQSAAGQANSQSQQQIASDQGNQDDNKKKKNTQIRKVGRVTVILASRS